MELPEGWKPLGRNPDEVRFKSWGPPPFESVLELAALGIVWIESEPLLGSTYASRTGGYSDHFIPISDYIAKRRGENGIA